MFTPVRHPRFLLLYPALQFAPDEQAKPDGSLSLPYLAGALRTAGYEVRILDVAVGNDRDRLEDGFHRTKDLPTGLIRVGISEQRIAEELADADVIGVSSVFTPQTSMALALLRLVREVAPDRILIAGGVNARSLRDRFFDAGADVIFLSESEESIVDFASCLRGKVLLSEVGGIAYRDDIGRQVVQPPRRIVTDLDELPMPSWDLLPLDKYWSIARPHGGQFPASQSIRYGSVLTSRGCPYRCRYCHVSTERSDGPFGGIGTFRVHSIERVVRELATVQGLGVDHVFFEDDSLLANKARASRLFREVARMGLRLADVNGINVAHLFERRGGSMAPDRVLIELLAEAGFGWLTLPFESASPRLIAKYASSKWDPAKTDAGALIRACTEAGIRTVGNYMIGYPDETVEEMQETVRMARRHVDEGMNHALFFNVMPFPGSELFEEAIAGGQLPRDFDPDVMKWTRAVLRHTPVSRETLEAMRQLAFLAVNRSEYVDYKLGHRVTRLVGGEGGAAHADRNGTPKWPTL